MLKVAYRLHFKEWYVLDVNKVLCKETKEFIQGQFWEEMSLLVDRPKAKVGSSNNGNTARKFFSNYSHSASILGIDIELVYNMYVILQVISSSHLIDVEKFRSFCLKVYYDYIAKYKWYPFPTTVHKI